MNNTSSYEEAKKATFNISNTPVFSNSIEPGKLGENVLSYMTSKADILKISKLEPGEFFSGVVYCTRTFCSANVNDPKLYDITLTCIDGDGIQFSCKKWGYDEKVEHIDTPLYVEGVTIAYSDNVIRYRIDSFNRYMTEVPKSLFLKQIDNLTEQVEKFMDNINRVNIPCLSKLINYLLVDYKFLNMLQETTYKPTIGTRLGAKILISNTIISIIEDYKNNIGGIGGKIDENIYIPLTVLYMIDLAVKQSFYNSMTQKSIQVSTVITNAMYNSGCFSVEGEHQEKVQVIFNGLITTTNTKEVYNIPIECLLFNNALQTVERAIRCSLF